MGHLRTPEADSDIDSIWYFIAANSGNAEVADRFIESITDRFLLLARHPNIGRVRDEDLRPGLRSFPVGEYVIIYRIHEEDVLILRVLRGSRDIENLLGVFMKKAAQSRMNCAAFCLDSLFTLSRKRLLLLP